MPPVTRNQLKSDMGTPKTPSSKSPSDYKRSSATAKFLSRVDPTTKLTFFQIATIGTAVGIALFASISYLFLTGKVTLHGKATASALSSLTGKLEFVLKFQTLNVFWLLMMVALTGFRRVATGALNPLDGNEHAVAAQKQILQNSLEQFVLHLVNQSILTTNLAPDLLIRVIPMTNVLFITGRVMFWLGYPKYRTCGFLLNIFTNIAQTGYNLISFFRFFGVPI
ncbi:transmembrane protein 79-like [Brevipalpus obovatus]|uniref:transmembrane protein 79-like n=1 Tax=Brevipalpus obovatus TaxID=246614 RepID=UPI003D9DDFDB